jgi:serine O-acetyltransferase
MTLFKQIKDDWVNHRFGNWRMNVKSKILRAPLSILYRFLYRRARNLYGIELPYTAQIGQGVIIEHQHGIVIHGNVVIGNNCIIRQGVTIGNRYINKPTEAPVIGDNVNIGAGAKLLGNITIGDNVNIGANAVVVHDVPQNGLYVGFPKNIKA